MLISSTLHSVFFCSSITLVEWVIKSSIFSTFSFPFTWRLNIALKRIISEKNSSFIKRELFIKDSFIYWIQKFFYFAIICSTLAELMYILTEKKSTFQSRHFKKFLLVLLLPLKSSRFKIVKSLFNSINKNNLIIPSSIIDLFINFNFTYHIIDILVNQMSKLFLIAVDFKRKFINFLVENNNLLLHEKEIVLPKGALFCIK